jgi:hypothetical protein
MGPDLLGFIQKLPDCGVQCLSASLPASSCANPLDGNCICSDKTFQAAAEKCVIKSCKPLEAIEIARVQAEACQWPVRNRRADLLLPLIVEIPAVFCPFIRMYARWSTIRKLASDDWLVLLAGITYTAVLLIAQINGNKAFGVDIWTLKIEEMTQGLKWFFIGETLYLFSLGLTKVSVIFFYLRIFPQRSFRYISYACIAFITTSTLAFMFIQLFQCRPIAFTWEGWTSPNRKDKCLDVNILAYAAAGSSILQDIIVLVLPLPLVFGLHTGWRSKLGILVMFSLGIFVLVTSCVRLRYIVDFGETHNPSWDYTDPAIWSGLEVAVSLIVVCLPAIRLLLDLWKPGWVATAFSRSTTGNVTSSFREGKGSAIRNTWSGRRNSLHAIYRSDKGSGVTNDSEIELGPRLGDKIHGDVRTEIYPALDSPLPLNPQGNGIQVTTTTKIETNCWREERSSLSICSNELTPRQSEPR